MGKILCATRGGEASIHAQDVAIKRSKESGSPLYFFYVVDVEFLAQANYALRTDIVTHEMDKMADFLLAMATDRAEKAGVKAQAVIRHGVFVEQLIATIREGQITTVILGHPADSESIFREGIHSLAEQIVAETGAEVIVAHPEG